MNTDHSDPSTAKPATPPRAAPQRLRRGNRNSSIATEQAARKHWRGLLAAAAIRWPQLPREELATVDGNVHRLAGLVQMRCAISREESDQQVSAFFAEHPALA